MNIEPGAVVGGRYKLDRLLGEGGMGAVWAATHTITKKAVALKILHSERAADPTIRQRFLREARAACAVRHPNVVAVHDVFEAEDGAPMMVMDLLLGETLASKLARESVLSFSEVARIMGPVVSAVGTAHGLGIVHRDLKPENIFLADKEDGSGQIDVKVLDFGIAKLTSFEGLAANTSALTADGGMLGTPYYMSPEQVDGERDVDARSDIWSLGIILYQCLSGMMPTNGENLGQVFKIITRGAIPPLAERAPGLPPEVASLVDRMMARERSARPQTLREVAEVLGRASGAPIPLMPKLGDSSVRLSSSPVSALARSIGEAQTVAAQTGEGVVRTVSPRRRPGALVAGAGVVVTCALLGTAAFWLWARHPAAPSAAGLATAFSAQAPASPSTLPLPTTTLSVADAAPQVERPAPAETVSSAPHIPSGRPHSGHVGAPAVASSAQAPPTSVERPGGVYEKAPF